MTTFDVVVVGYNARIESCSAVARALASPLVRSVIFCDNSTQELILAHNSRAANGRVVYLAMGGNAGLSKAYNLAARLIESQYLVVFDDDTEVPEDYFDRASRWVEGTPVGIFAPVVRAGGTTISPCVPRYPGLFAPARDLSKLPAGFSAINSGMVIARRIFETCRYDERLFLDFVDHQFVADARRSGVRVRVMSDIVLNQDYSENSDDCASARARLTIFRKDSAVYYSSISGKATRLIQIIRRRARMVGKP